MRRASVIEFLHKYIGHIPYNFWCNSNNENYDTNNAPKDEDEEIRGNQFLNGDSNNAPQS